jgi:hypothetical protein
MLSKKRLRISVVLSFIVFIVLFTSSCVTANLPTTWVDQEFKEGPFKKIVVIGLFRNYATRKEFETEIVKRIQANSSTVAISSLKFMKPDSVYEQGSMEAQFKEMGIDGILIVRTKSIENVERYVPGTSYTVTRSYPMYYYNYNNYYKYYRHTQEIIYEPGYYKNSYIVCTESTLFQNSNDNMIWMMENNTTHSYETIDGITDPKNEAIRTAGLIYKDLNLNNFLMEK